MTGTNNKRVGSQLEVIKKQILIDTLAISRGHLNRVLAGSKNFSPEKAELTAQLLKTDILTWMKNGNGTIRQAAFSTWAESGAANGK